MLSIGLFFSFVQRVIEWLQSARGLLGTGDASLNKPGRIQPANPTVHAGWDEGDRRERARGVSQEREPGRVTQASQATAGWELMGRDEGRDGVRPMVSSCLLEDGVSSLGVKGKVAPLHACHQRSEMR